MAKSFLVGRRQGENAARPGLVQGHKRQVALLGTGYIADWHARAIRTMPDLLLAAVCDQSQPRAVEFAKKFKVPRVYESLEKMLRTEDLYAVHVLVPPDIHFQAAKEILQAGSNTFIEKPMCSRSEDCDALNRLAEQQKSIAGVGHNFLFSECYEQLRNDLRSGSLGSIDHLSITWHKELPQVTQGPFDIWMLRDPRNVMLEVGSHCVAQVLDLLGFPDSIRARASNSVALPSGQNFYRRWQVDALVGRTAVDLRFSFVPGFTEYTIHIRGSLASASVDFERGTYTLRRHRALDEDFDRYAMVLAQVKSLRRQARRTLLNYGLSKLHLGSRGTPYGASIADAMRSFYTPGDGGLDDRISARRGRDVIRLCEEIGNVAGVESQPALVVPPIEVDSQATRHLVLGATGFIGRELTRQLIESGKRVRVFVRSPSKLALDLETRNIECQRGDLSDAAALRQAMTGIECVYHVAKSNVKSWNDYERYEIGTTRKIAEAALGAGVRRLIYTGTIDSYYAGDGSQTITEETPLDPNIARRNLYARAKATSEGLLSQMHRDHGLPVVILRPGIVIGRGGNPMHWGVGMWWYGAICQTWGDGRTLLPLVLVEDVAKALIAASEVPGIEGESFNLVADPCLTAQEYLDEMDRSCGVKVQRYRTPILNFYLNDLLKWIVKVIVRHPDRRLPSYRDWASRQQLARFDCTRAKMHLGWKPKSDRLEMVRLGIQAPAKETFG